MNNKRDCNQCGDYEYCAFDYEKCTGFIPGDNYVYEKAYEEGISTMTELTPLEYIWYEDEFSKKNTEYLEKRADIYRRNDAGEIRDEEAYRMQEDLEKEYSGYTDIYESDRYCVMSDALETLYLAKYGRVSGNFKNFLNQQKKYRGKHVKMGCDGVSGILQDVCISIDDFYYIIKDDRTGKVIFDTGVDDIVEVDGVKI